MERMVRSHKATSFKKIKNSIWIYANRKVVSLKQLDMGGDREC